MMASDFENLLSNIRALYRPFQPTVKPHQGTVKYSETAPPDNLLNFVYCFWDLRSVDQLAEDFEYKVVADGCIDIFFELRSPKDIFVMGFCDQFTSFNLGRNFHFVGLRFFPSIVPLLFGVDALNLKNNFHRLSDVLPEFYNQLVSQLGTEASASNFESMTTSFLLNHLINTKLYVDMRFFDALISIFSCHGMIDTREDLKTGLSPRQLRRVFNFHLGTTPKSFAKVVRFQKVIAAFQKDSSRDMASVYYELGFFDQAHFIKDFKKYYGVPPSRAID